MTGARQVLVKKFPLSADGNQYALFLRDLEPHLESERPLIVLDFSEVQQVSRAGIELLLLGMEEAMKRNGDVKLACVSPSLAGILEMTRADRLFEIYQDCNAAIESFHQFSGIALEPFSRPRADLAS